MQIEINKITYEVKVGNRALLGITSSVGSEGLAEGKISFDAIVDVFWNSIRKKGELTKEQLEDYVDESPDALELIMQELSAFKSIEEEAKK